MHISTSLASQATEEEVAKVSDIALQEVFGILADEADLSKEGTLRWVHGLLCLLEKPLLADQAADLC